MAIETLVDAIQQQFIELSYNSKHKIIPSSNSDSTIVRCTCYVYLIDKIDAWKLGHHLRFKYSPQKTTRNKIISNSILIQISYDLNLT